MEYGNNIKEENMSASTRTKVVIQCEGGLVNAVYSNDPFIEVEIFDYDELESLEETIEINEEEKKIERLEKEIKDLKCIF